MSKPATAIERAQGLWKVLGQQARSRLVALVILLLAISAMPR